MKENKLAIFIALCGWVVLVTFSLHEYATHGFISFTHFFIPQHPIDVVFRIIILSAPVGSTITAYLISERDKLLGKTKLSEKQLRHAANEWMTTFDSMPYGVMLTDSNNTIIRANKYILNLFDTSIETLLLNKKCYDLICKKIKPTNFCPAIKSVVTQKTELLEYFDHDKGNIYTESITPIFDKKGSVVSKVHVLIDITDIKEKENKLTQSKNAFFNMLKDLNSAYKELKDIYDSLIIMLSNIIDAKSTWTKGHSVETARYAAAIAIEMGLHDRDIETLRTGALLHDIGKIETYDIILDKPDKLDDKEFSLIRNHTLKGEELLSPIKGLEKILPLIRSHHERVDGTGYPDRLKGDEIPLLARILCVADSYDAMISDRPYRPGCKKEYAISELKRYSGIQFDSAVVEAFLIKLEQEG